METMNEIVKKIEIKKETDRKNIQSKDKERWIVDISPYQKDK